MSKTRDHGGGLDAAVAKYGGVRGNWVDLSTGINPVPYTVGDISADAWTALPDQAAMDRVLTAARAFWDVPDSAMIVPAGGASALIAQMPRLIDDNDSIYIRKPTYNEHAAAFETAGHLVNVSQTGADRAQVFVHPNNPTGDVVLAKTATSHPLNIIDESFCDVMPHETLMSHSDAKGVVILKSFGKFWGLAGLRLGFAIGQPDTVGPLRDMLGPWAVSGPALEIGARALEDFAWADATRERLAADAARLDELVGWTLVGGTDLFRTYEVPDAAALQHHLARGHVWSRIFPYSKTWLRLGLPAPDQWDQLSAALDGSA